MSFLKKQKALLKGRKSYRLFLVLAILIILLFALDQGSKYAVVGKYFASDFGFSISDPYSLHPSAEGSVSGHSHSLVGNLLGVQLAFNTGAAWSALGSGAGTIILTVLSLLMGIAFLYVFVFYSYKFPVYIQIALALATAGDLGNLVDRFGHLFHLGIYKYGVVDFLIFPFWPQFGAIFNLADSFLVIAMFLLLIGFAVTGIKELVEKKKAKADGKEEEEDDQLEDIVKKNAKEKKEDSPHGESK
mgnify:CR=1 FL=1